ncbi:uncharacterized protein LOC112464774 [Temnothorax curvispinosus]|uniref:Uncharacterized protein LOC112464774 n=2 Tax=Temnothorax curvispinosus TaxID=300111 RepID=A0A6J1R3X5_9HYME|nr:uncharacterized protein LOC112464774 [Temnothorax curvispinosus]
MESTASSEITLVNTCGVCEEIVEESLVPTHKCLEGFDTYCFDKNRYFYPICDDGKIIRRNAINNGKEDITLDETSQYEESTMVDNSSESTDIDELLIEEVSKHEVLYNYSILVQQRNRTVTTETWTKVSKALEGRLDPKQAAKKWKTLRDSYSREQAKEKLPSRAARPTSKRKWKHFDRMDFLRDTIYRKKTSDNLLSDENENIPPIPKRRQNGTAFFVFNRPCRRVAQRQPLHSIKLQMQLLQLAQFLMCNCQRYHFQTTNRMR